jgi:hypothetical protein
VRLSRRTPGLVHRDLTVPESEAQSEALDAPRSGEGTTDSSWVPPWRSTCDDRVRDPLRAEMMARPSSRASSDQAGWSRAPRSSGATDLGRVLAIAWLEFREAMETWPQVWADALRACFPGRWRPLASAWTGLGNFSRSREDLEQAHQVCVNGLLASRMVSLEQLRIVGSASAGRHPAVGGMA